MGRLLLLLLGVALALAVAASAGAEIYRWTDEKGTVRATTDIGQVPEQFRHQIKKGGLTPRGKLSNPSEPPASPVSDPAPVQPPKGEDSAPAKQNPAPR